MNAGALMLSWCLLAQFDPASADRYRNGAQESRGPGPGAYTQPYAGDRYSPAANPTAGDPSGVARPGRSVTAGPGNYTPAAATPVDPLADPNAYNAVPSRTPQSAPSAAVPPSAAPADNRFSSGQPRRDEFGRPGSQPPDGRMSNPDAYRNQADGMVSVDSAARRRRQEMLAGLLAPAADTALSGQSLRLVDALRRTSPGTNQSLSTVIEYWQLWLAAAHYRQRVDELARLEETLGEGAGSRPELLSALAGARAAVHEAQLTADRRQHGLAARLRMPADQLAWPIDVPHTGRYRTHYETLFQGRNPPGDIRLVVLSLPLRQQILEARAQAVQSGWDNLEAAADEYAAGRLSEQALLTSYEDLGRQQREFLESVYAYNADIASYALRTSAGGADAETIVSMLIRTEVPAVAPASAPAATRSNPPGVLRSRAAAESNDPKPAAAAVATSVDEQLAEERPGPDSVPLGPPSAEPLPIGPLPLGPERPAADRLIVPVAGTRESTPAPSPRQVPQPTSPPDLTPVTPPAGNEPVNSRPAATPGGRPSPRARPSPTAQPIRATHTTPVENATQPAPNRRTPSSAPALRDLPAPPTSGSPRPAPTSTTGSPETGPQDSPGWRPRDFDPSQTRQSYFRGPNDFAQPGSYGERGAASKDAEALSQIGRFGDLLALSDQKRASELALRLDTFRMSDVAASLTLEDALAGVELAARAELIARYWNVYQARMTHQAADRHEQLWNDLQPFVLARRTAPNGAREMLVWRLVHFELVAQAVDRQIELLVARYHLAEALQRGDQESWPDVVTPAHAGPYRLKLNKQAPNQSQRHDVLHFATGVNLGHELLMDRADQVVAADLAAASTMARFGQQAVSLSDARGAALRRGEAVQAYAAALADYNESIGNYVTRVVQPDISAARLTRALVLDASGS